jgi:hypothetical protein
MIKSNRFIIGTAAWCQNYGVLNRSSALSVEQIFDILDYSLSLKFNTLDTALNYGNIASCLTNYSGLSKFNVISKFTFKLENLKKTTSEIERNLLYFSDAKSLNLLIHNTNFLKDLCKWPEFLNTNIVNNYEDINFGISLYTPQELDIILKSSFLPKFIQLPICFGDFRWHHFIANLSSELLGKLNKIELHARSIFLQGSLLRKSDRHNFAQPLFNSEIARWWDFVEKSRDKPYEICLNSIMQNSQIDNINVGINSISELSTLKQFIESDFVVKDNYGGFSFAHDFLDIRKWKRA